MRGMDIPAEAQRHLADDQVAWLTTVADSGAPVPFPVWFLPDGDDIVVFTQPGARRVRNITERPLVSLNFNSDPHGGDVWIITGTASVRPGVKPSTSTAYVDKYQAAIEGELHTTLAEVDATYDTEIRIRPTKIRTV